MTDSIFQMIQPRTPAAARRAVLATLRHTARANRAHRLQLAAAEDAALELLGSGASAAWALSIGRRCLPRKPRRSNRWRNNPLSQG